MEPDSMQRIAAAVTPAVMVSACGLIALGLDNQAARVSTRIREIAREFRGDIGDRRRDALLVQMEVLGRRHAHYVTALRLNYAALLCFVITSLLYLLRGAFRMPDLLPTAAFLAGVVMLALMSFFVLASLRLSRDAIQLEHRQTLAHREA